MNFLNTSEILLFLYASFMAAIIPGPISFFSISLGVLKNYKFSLIRGLGNSVAFSIQVICAYSLVSFSIYTRDIILNISILMGVIYMICLAYNIYLHNPFLYKKDNKRNVVFISKKEVFFKSFFLALFPELIINSDNSNRTLIILTSIIFIVVLVSFLINSYIGNITKNVLEKEVFAKFMGNTFSLLLLILSIYSIFLKMTG